MSLNEVTLTLDAYNGQQVPVGAGTAFLTPTAAVSFPTDSVWLWAVPVEVSLVPPSGAPSGWLPTVTLVACDNSGANPSSWGWVLTLQAGPGAPPGFTFSLDFSAGAQQNLSAQVPAQVGTALYDYLPQPSGTPEVGDVPVYVGPGQATAWGNPGDASLFLLKTGGTITGSLVVDDELSTSNNVLDDGSGNLAVAGTVTVGGSPLGSAAFDASSAFDAAGAAAAVETYANETFATLTQLPSGSNPVPVGSGGTGATTAAGALTNLGALPLTGGTLSKAASAGGILVVVNTDSAPTAYNSQIICAASADRAFSIQVSGDTTPRFGVDSNGEMHWGSGSAGSDTDLYRNGAGQLKTDGSIVVGTTLTAEQLIASVGAPGGLLLEVINTSTPTVPNVSIQNHAAGDLSFGIEVSGDADYRFTIDSNGMHSWGSGSAAADTTLSRSSSNTLTLSGGLKLGSISISNASEAGLIGIVNTQGSPTSPTVWIDAHAAGDLAYGVYVSGDTDMRFTVDSNGLHSWGPGGTTAADTTLYRSNTATLQASSHLIVQGGSTANPILKVVNADGAPTVPISTITATDAGDLSFGIEVNGDADYRFAIDSNGKHSWGPGNAAADVTMYRAAAGTIALTGIVQLSSVQFFGTISNNGTNPLTMNNQAITGVSNLAVTGLTGATAVSRYVGATASGAPTSGTFAIGDFAIDQTGKAWVCTAAGTPGTWAQVGSNVNGLYVSGGATVEGTLNGVGGLQSNGAAVLASTLWTTISSGFPTGWSGQVHYRLLGGDVVQVAWALYCTSGTVVTGADTITTLPSGYYYPSDNSIASGNISIAGSGNSYAPVYVSSAGNFNYDGPSFTASGTCYWYGGGIYPVDV